MRSTLMIVGLLLRGLLPAVLGSPLPSCQNGTAADYVALGSTGCVDGREGVISNFEFSTNSGFSVPLGSIQIAPSAPDVFGTGFPSSVSGLTLHFSPALVAAPSQFVDLRIGFTITSTYPGITHFVADGYKLLPEIGGIGIFFPNGTATITIDGNTLPVGDACCVAAVYGLVPEPHMSIDTRYDFPIWDSQGRSFQTFEMGVFDVFVPEPSTWLLTLLGLGLGWKSSKASLPVRALKKGPSKS